MGWLRNISFTPSSSLVKIPETATPPDSPTHDNNNNNNNRGVVWRFDSSSKYSRHKKLIRKLLLISRRERGAANSVAPHPVSSFNTSHHHAVPLPLPEVSTTPTPHPPPNSNSAIPHKDCPLPSPNISAPSHIINKSIFDSREKQKKEDQVETRSPRRLNQEDATGYPTRSRNTFWIDVPSRSAPNSPLASPTLSPQKTCSGNLSNLHHVAAPLGAQGWSAPELSNFYYVAPVGNHVWSAPELPSSAFMWGVPPAFFDCSTFSTESSPMHSPRMHSPRMHSPRMHSPRTHSPRTHSPRTHSPRMHSPRMHSPKVRSPHQDPRSPMGGARRESAGPLSVHPLPLPPGIPMPSPSTPVTSPSTPITQSYSKTEAMSMKNQWQKGKLIGRGTFGSVYVASNRKNGALCAMKEVELFPDDPKSAECIKQLQQEIKLLSQLKHPNIVQYYGSDIVEDRLYIYLEYVHPGSINKYVREHCGTMTESVVRNFTRHILSGLAYLHSTKTMHRDIKGANLLVDSCGVVKLADFGMAKHLTGQVSDLSLKGSPYWMAPELLLSVMQKDSNSDHALAVDIWSLGCTIIEMFTGKPPWSEYEGAAAMFKVMKDTPTIPESLSYEARDFLRCCFQRNPAKRPTAAMLLEHPFMKNLQHPDAPSFSPAVAGADLTDKCFSPSEQYSSKLDQISLFPCSQNSKGKFGAESVIGRLSHHEASDLTLMSRYSPRSTLEAFPLLSPRSVHNVHYSANAPGRRTIH